MAQPFEFIPTPPAGDFLSQNKAEERPVLDHADDSYVDVHILNERKSREYRARWGEGVLQTFDVRVIRSYADDKKKTRVTIYPVTVGRRTDVDKQLLPIVSHSDALTTTMQADGTATSHYFWNSARAGFPTINVGVKRDPNPITKYIPKTLPLHEMADDSLVATLEVAQAEELGIEMNEKGMIPMGVSGYSRGKQLALMKAARAGLFNIEIEHMQVMAGGPRDAVSMKKIIGRLAAAAGHEARAAGRQLLYEPHHAIHNYLNAPTHSIPDLISYAGDAFALLTGSVGKAMHHVDRDIQGAMTVMQHDPFGLPEEYGVDFVEHESDNTHTLRPFSNLTYRVESGAHLSGMDSQYVQRDRDEWQAAANRRLGFRATYTAQNL